MSGIAHRLAELSHRVTGIDQKLASIAKERNDHAVEASQGGKVALQKIASLDSEFDQLNRSRSTLTSAADQLDAQLREEEAAFTAAQRAEREQKAREAGSCVITLNCEIDAALVQVREMLERRTCAINALRAAGGCDARQAFRLISRECISASFYAAQLHQHAAMEPVGVQQIRPLADSNRVIPHT